MIRKVLMSTTVQKTLYNNKNIQQITKTTSVPLGYHTRKHKQL